MTSSPEWMQSVYQKWRAATWEKVSVLVFIVLSMLTLMGIELPHRQLGELFSGDILPILNILVAIQRRIRFLGSSVNLRDRGLL